MRKNTTRRFWGICVMATCCSLYAGGCTTRIAQSVLTGFGFSLGALPAQVVSDYVTGLLGGNADANP